MIFHGEINLPNHINNEFSLQFTARPPASIQINLNLKDDVTRDDWQRLFLAQNSTAMLEQCCSCSRQRRTNVVMLCCAKNPGLTNIVITFAYSRMYRGQTDKLQFCNVYGVVVCMANENGKVQICVQ